MTKLGEIKIAFKYRGIERQKTYIIVRDSAGEVLMETSVKRCVEDQHDKLLARFQAFRKAMHRLMIENRITRQQRKEIWAAFVENVKVPSKINLDSPKREKKVKAMIAV
jgi:hypothetical protein